MSPWVRVIPGHVCREKRTCTCSSVAQEPKENCPVHGFIWPPRCGECGKFLLWERAPAKEERSENI